MNALSLRFFICVNVTERLFLHKDVIEYRRTSPQMQEIHYVMIKEVKMAVERNDL